MDTTESSLNFPTQNHFLLIIAPQGGNDSSTPEKFLCVPEFSHLELFKVGSLEQIHHDYESADFLISSSGKGTLVTFHSISANFLSALNRVLKTLSSPEQDVMIAFGTRVASSDNHVLTVMKVENLRLSYDAEIRLSPLGPEESMWMKLTWELYAKSEEDGILMEIVDTETFNRYFSPGLHSP
jgi:hypothetical protein